MPRFPKCPAHPSRASILCVSIRCFAFVFVSASTITKRSARACCLTMRLNFRLIVNDLLAVLPHAVQVGQVKDAAGGTSLEQEKFTREDSDLSDELTAILTRDALFGA